MIVDNLYQQAEVGAETTMNFHAHFSNVDQYPLFVQELERLDELAEQNLVEIIYQHQEEQSGDHFVDLVRFRRLK